MALHRKKGFTAKQSKRTSARMTNSMVGTHVKRSGSGASGLGVGSSSNRRMNASSVSFSDSRRQGRAQRGEVQAFVPNTSSRESVSAASKRVNRKHYAEQLQQKSRRNSIIKIVAVVMAIIAVAVAAGYFTYSAIVGSSTNLHDSDAKSALTTPTSGEPYYVLISAELGATAQSLDNEGPDVILLTRVDTSSRDVTFVPIPSNLSVVYNSQTMRISDVIQNGDAAFVEAVADFADVDIAHYFKLEDGQLAGLVDALGGVTMTLDQEIDDPNAGDIYIPKGEQTLNGQQAIVFLRATNVTNDIDGQMTNQVKFASTLLAQLFSNGAVGFAATLSSIGEYFSTDMASGDIVSLATSLSDMLADDFTLVLVPGYENTETSLSGGTVTYYISSSRWSSVMSDLDGGDTSAGTTVIETVDPGSFTIEVQNGASITGAATATAEKLTSLGFKVEETGNADQQIYEETLVIYDNENGLQQAQTVINALGTGRAVYGQGYYEYDTNILLILGGDYNPNN